MFRKLVALVTLVSASVVGSTMVASADPGYTSKIPTVTTIEVTSQGPGEPVIIHVSASANYPTPPAGDIAVRLYAADEAPAAKAPVPARTSAKALLTTTVHFVNDPVRIQGPALPKGKYVGTAALSPDNAGLFDPSSDRTNFRIGQGAGPGGDADNGGGLPDTGGPNMMWLLLGTGLVVAGAGSVAAGRRRSPVAA